MEKEITKQFASSFSRAPPDADADAVPERQDNQKRRVFENELQVVF